MTHVPGWAIDRGVVTQGARVDYYRLPVPNDERQLLDGMPFYGEDFQGEGRYSDTKKDLLKGLAFITASMGLGHLANEDTGLPKIARSASRLASIGIGVAGAVKLGKGFRGYVCDFTDSLNNMIQESEEAWEA